MKKKKKLRPFPPKKPVRCWHLIVIDQEPIRKKAASECGKAMTQLEKAKAEWRQFDREDRPAYSRWMAATFGALMTKIRETESEMREKELLIHEVELEYMFGGRGGYAGAYKRVMRERESPQGNPQGGYGDDGGSSRFQGGPPPRPEDDPFFVGEDDDEEDLIEAEMLFDDFARVVLGINPDRLSDAKYEQMFQEFREKVLGQGKKGASAEGAKQGSGKGAAREDAPPAPVKPEAVRIKEIYRLLVRRLHPDLRADKDAEVSHFWHEVQEAYAQGNLERLEMLLALTDLQANTAGDHISLFQMRSVLSELRKAFRTLQQSIRSARKDPAWSFSRFSNREPVRVRVERELKKELDDYERALAQMKAQIARWEAPQKRHKPPPPFKSAPPKAANKPKSPPPKSARPQKGQSFRQSSFYPRYEQTGFGF